ncbi:importin 13 [Aspergillus sp. HF37]|nr:importin 13 [Aspergillus sp. HF37]
MSEAQVVSLLYFSNILAEELDKRSADARENEEQRRVAQNTGDAFCLVEFVLRHVLQQEASGNPVSDADAGTEAINSYHVCHFCYYDLSGMN